MLMTTDSPARETSPRFYTETKITAKELHEMVSLFARLPNVPPPWVNALRSIAWLIEVAGFREREDNLMADDNYEESLSAHRAALSRIIADGEAVLRDIEESGFEHSITKFTVDDLKSTLESLHLSFHCEHGSRNSQKTNDLIAQLFDVSES